MLLLPRSVWVLRGLVRNLWHRNRDLSQANEGADRIGSLGSEIVVVEVFVRLLLAILIARGQCMPELRLEESSLSDRISRSFGVKKLYSQIRSLQTAARFLYVNLSVVCTGESVGPKVLF